MSLRFRVDRATIAHVERKPDTVIVDVFAATVHFSELDGDGAVPGTDTSHSGVLPVAIPRHLRDSADGLQVAALIERCERSDEPAELSFDIDMSATLTAVSINVGGITGVATSAT